MDETLSDPNATRGKPANFDTNSAPNGPVGAHIVGVLQALEYTTIEETARARARAQRRERERPPTAKAPSKGTPRPTTGYALSTCTRCCRDITFARTAAGKLMPLDPARYDPADRTANVAVFRDHTGRLNARSLKAGQNPEPYEWRAMPHFATCPAATAERDARAGRLVDDGVIPFPKRRKPPAEESNRP